MDWKAETEKFQLTARQGDRVLINAPAASKGAIYNGKEGTIHGFGVGWIHVDVDGECRRFRSDELKVL